MGTSTDAILAYGYDLGEMHDWEEPDAHDDGFADWVEHRLLESVAGFTDNWSEDDEAYFARKRAAQSVVGVEVEYYCSYDYPMFLLVVSGTQVLVERGDSHRLVAADLAVKPEWQGMLTRAMSALGIKPPGEPGWFLVSMWG